MNKCAFCGSQTPLYYQHVPMCLDCSEARDGDAKDNGVDYMLSIKGFESGGRADTALPARADRALFAFLRGELSLGLNYAQTAKKGGRNSETEKQARERAQESVETIRWFRCRISDPAVHLELQDGAARLEQLLSERLSIQI